MKVIIVDDHPLARKGIEMILNSEKDTEIIGEAQGVQEALEKIKKLRPDLILLDIKLGKENGLELVKRLKKYNESDFKCKIVVITSSNFELEFKQLEKFNIDGYILKDAMPEEIIHALRVVGKGRKYYDPGVYEIFSSSEQKNKQIDCLTEREIEVLKALGKGFKNKGIAKELFITEFTVKKHISQILSKLGLQDRTQAAVFAVKNGLVISEL